MGTIKIVHCIYFKYILDLREEVRLVISLIHTAPRGPPGGKSNDGR